MSSCGAGKRDKAKEMAKMDSISMVRNADSISATNTISSSAAVVSKKDSTRKFVRTADLKFRVKNVYRSSLEIEKITAAYDGFVTYTNLSSTIDRKEITPISADSSLETVYYDVVNEIIIRVPNYNLDSTIRHIAPLIVYLDFRTITANDVSLLLAANNMVQSRITKHTNKLSQISNQKNIKDTDNVKIEDKIYERQAELEKVKMDKMKLMDDINFSTIKIYIYQRQTFKRELIENDKNIKAYKPGLWTDIKDAVVFSYNILIGIILFIIRMWAIWLIIFVGYILVKMYLKKHTKD